MGLISKQTLSSQVGGMPSAIGDDVSPGAILHDSTTDASVLDEVWLFLSNNHTAAVDVTLGFDNGGGVQEKVLTVPAKTEITALAGIPFNNITISAYVLTTDLDRVVYSGFVNRIDQS